MRDIVNANSRPKINLLEQFVHQIPCFGSQPTMTVSYKVPFLWLEGNLRFLITTYFLGNDRIVATEEINI